MPMTDTPASGGYHGASVKNPATYEALMRKGLDKTAAAAISNAAYEKTGRKGKHRHGRRKQRRH